MTALITGASSGIGLDLAKCFARGRHQLVLVARSGDRLEALATELRAAHGVTIDVLVSDLSKPAAAQEICDALRERAIAVDCLVNNAGFGSHGRFDCADVQQQLDMIQVNVAALVHLTRLLLPPMIERGQGRIMNVASTAGFQPGPLMAVYYASKAFVISFSEAIAVELKHTGVTVTALCPGPTTTEFQQRAGMEKSKLFERNTMTSPDVARIGYRAMLAGKRLCIPGVKNKLLMQAVRVSPRKLVTAITKRMNEMR